MQNKDKCYIVTAFDTEREEWIVYSNMDSSSALRIYKNLENNQKFGSVALSKQLEVKKTIEVTYSLA